MIYPEPQKKPVSSLNVIIGKIMYARTRASDSKHLPAVILNVCIGVYTRIMFNIVISI